MVKVGCMSFSAPLVKAILAGDKVQTRRVISDKFTVNADTDKNGVSLPGGVYAPHKVGDVLWVREPGKVIDVKDYAEDGMDLVIEYTADEKVAAVEVPARMSEMWEVKYKDRWPAPDWVACHQGIPNGIFKEAARIFLKITNVRVERLASITEQDARKEGALWDARMWPWSKYFQELWDSMAKPGTKWADNPFVWVYDFELTDRPANWFAVQ